MIRHHALLKITDTHTESQTHTHMQMTHTHTHTDTHTNLVAEHNEQSINIRITIITRLIINRHA